MATNNPNIIGSDGAVPKYDPDGRWTIWNLDEVYLGGPATGKFVVKVNDYVRDLVNRKTYIVTALSDLLIPTMVDVNAVDGDVLDEDLIIGPSAGRQSETYRVYVDASTIPATLCVDARLKILGSMSSYARIFRGTDLSATGEVVSVVYSNGQYLDDKISLELAAYDSHDNHTIKNVPPAHTNKVIKDGELLTLVIYSQTDRVISKKVMMAENTSYIRSVNANQKYISHVSIKTPFLDVTDTRVIKYPINVPVAGLNIYGNVHYSDGSIRSLPVDGTKFRLLGLESFVATIVGQEVPLVLSYRLDDDETVYGAVSADGKFITEPFTLLTQVENGVFTPKLYAYPEWNNTLSTYTLRWFLMDLRRDIMIDVTAFVRFNESSDVWTGNTFNNIQNLSVRINLSDVSESFPDYIHTQTLFIILRRAGNVAGSKFEIGFEPNQANLFGQNLEASAAMTNQNLWKVNLKNDISNLVTWIDQLYYNTKPLFNNRREDRPVMPTHFAIVVDGARFEQPITSWDKDITVNSNLDLYSNIYIEFLKIDAGNTLKLSVAGLPIKKV